MSDFDDSFPNNDFLDTNASQILSETAIDTIDDPFETFTGENPVVRKARAAKTKMEDQIKSLTLSVDNHKESLESAKAELSSVDGEMGTISARLMMAKKFLEKAVRSTSEQAFVNAIPGTIFNQLSE